MLKKIAHFFKRQSNIRYIAVGFLSIILIGSGILMIPGLRNEGVNLKYIDALYTSTSAVCVTGLVTIDVHDTFNMGGQAVVMLLIQFGGLGITTLGAGLILAIRRKVSLKERNIIQDTFNFDDAKDLLKIFKRVFIYTFIIELIGAGLSLIAFSKYHPIGEAAWKSLFHSIAAFNNSGFDITGNFQNLQPYQADILLNLVTCALIILGGLGFLVISDIIRKRGRFKHFSLQTKVVLVTTFTLLMSGMFMIKLCERSNVSWLGAFFTSTTTRTAGFSTYNFHYFNQGSQLIMIVLMFIGASPGSTGGGIKTTTLFVMFIGIRSMITHKSPHAFKYQLSNETIKKSFVVTTLALCIVLLGTFLIACCEYKTPGDFTIFDILFETVSAYATVGLSTGITPILTIGSKIISVIIMYIGRVGPLTFFSLWYSGKDEYYQYSEGVIPIG